MAACLSTMCVSLIRYLEAVDMSGLDQGIARAALMPQLILADTFITNVLRIFVRRPSGFLRGHGFACSIPASWSQRQRWCRPRVSAPRCLSQSCSDGRLASTQHGGSGTCSAQGGQQETRGSYKEAHHPTPEERLLCRGGGQRHIRGV